MAEENLIVPQPTRADALKLIQAENFARQIRLIPAGT